MTDATESARRPVPAEGPTDPSPVCSVIIPAYNSDAWLAEAIDSVLAQTVGQDRLQIVLVDDGSTDGTPGIVDEYAIRFPGCVTAIHQENRGVAEALNAGLDACRSPYVTFLGSDDRLSPDAVEAVITFLDTDGSSCDLAAIAIELSGTRRGPHWNNRARFETTRVVDVNEEWNTPHLHGGGTFIRMAALANYGIRFDGRLFVTEDATLNTMLILHTMRYGVVAGPRYYNQRHPVGVSLVSGANFNPEFYTTIPRWAYGQMLEYGRRLHGSPPRYAQAVVAYDLVWRFRDARLHLLSADQLAEYAQVLRTLLAEIEPDVIIAQHAAIEQRLRMLSVREGREIGYCLRRSGLGYWLGETLIYSFDRQVAAGHRPAECFIEFFEPCRSRVAVTGHFRAPAFPGLQYGFLVNGRFVEAESDHRREITRHSLGEPVSVGHSYTATIPNRAKTRVRPVIKLGPEEDAPIVPVRARMGSFSYFSSGPNLLPYRRDGRMLYRWRSNYRLQIDKLGAADVIREELRYLHRAHRGGVRTSLLALRFAALAARAVRHKRTWIISDHKLEAGDNGEALFRYCQAHPVKDLKVYLALSRKSTHYKDLAAVGPVLEPDSWRFKLAYLNSEWVLSSAGDEFVVNPMGRDTKVVNDIRPRKFGFLQHGVTNHDQSSWLNRWNKGFELFVTSGEREREAICHDRYGYRPEQIVLTGMPRYDSLTSRPEGIVLFAPTWRRALVGSLDRSTGRNQPYPGFTDTDYFAFWNRLIHDDRLNEALQASGLRGLFALHPSHSAELAHYTPSAQVDVLPYPYEYNRLFRTSDLLVTDYSSVAFDFAYLHKPVVYAQFDAEEFYGSHLYKRDYFDFAKDGFGPVCSDYESTLDTVVDLVRHGCAMSPAFSSRVDEFFAYFDQQNSARVYQAISERSRRTGKPTVP